MNKLNTLLIKKNIYNKIANSSELSSGTLRRQQHQQQPSQVSATIIFLADGPSVLLLLFTCPPFTSSAGAEGKIIPLTGSLLTSQSDFLPLDFSSFHLCVGVCRVSGQVTSDLMSHLSDCPFSVCSSTCHFTVYQSNAPEYSPINSYTRRNTLFSVG